MRSVRYLLTWLALAVASAISIVAGVEVLLGSPTDRTVERSEELREWLLTTDAAREPLSTRRRYAYQLTYELREPSPWFADPSPADVPRLRANVEELARVWLLDEVEDYHSLPERRRPEFIVQELEELRSWQPPQALFPGDGLTSLMPLASRSLQRLDRRQRARVEMFVHAMTRQAMAQPLSNLLPDHD